MGRQFILCVLFGLVVFCLASCMGDDSIDEGQVQEFDVDFRQAEFFSFSSLFDTLEYVPLDSDKGILLGNVFRVKVFGRYVIVLDDPGYDFIRLSVFDRKGELYSSISLRGEGPERLIFIDDVWVDVDSGDLFVLDHVQQKIIRYDRAGSFLEYIRVPSRCMQFVPASDSFDRFWFYFDNHPVATNCEEMLGVARRDKGAIKGKDIERVSRYNVRHVDLTNCALRAYVPIRPSLMGVTLGYPFFSNFNSSHQYFYHTWFSDTVYWFRAEDPTSFRPFVSFDFGENAFSREDEARFAAINGQVEKMRYLNSIQNKVRYFRQIGHASGRLWARFTCRGVPYLISVALDSKERTFRLLKNNRRAVPNDFDLMTFLQVETAFSEEAFVYKIPAHALHDFFELSEEQAAELPLSDPRRRRFERVRRILKNVSRDDNPILVFAKLKEEAIN